MTSVVVFDILFSTGNFFFARETLMDTIDDLLENRLDCNNLGQTERNERTNV